MRIWVANTGQPYREGSSEGVGLSNLRQRLALMPGMLNEGCVQPATAECLEVSLARITYPEAALGLRRSGWQFSSRALAWPQLGRVVRQVSMRFRSGARSSGEGCGLGWAWVRSCDP